MADGGDKGAQAAEAKEEPVASQGEEAEEAAGARDSGGEAAGPAEEPAAEGGEEAPGDHGEQAAEAEKEPATKSDKEGGDLEGEAAEAKGEEPATTSGEAAGEGDSGGQAEKVEEEPMPKSGEEAAEAQEPAAAEAGEGAVEAAEGEEQGEWPEEWLEDYYIPVLTNSLGFFDGNRFYLRSFPVWYRWSAWQFPQHSNRLTEEKPETGSVDGVEFEQTMGRMTIWYELKGLDEGLTQEDLVVEMSCWELRVSVGRDVPPGKPGPRKIGPLCGELCRDVRRRHSWWRILEGGDEGMGRWLELNLAKLAHKAWTGPFSKDWTNPHRRTSFGWTPQHVSPQLAKLLRPEEETLQRVQPGEPQEPEKSLATGILPERLCTGVDDDADEDAEQISVLIHLDEETLELATGMVPLEELFAAEVEADRMDIYLRVDGFAICSGTMTGNVVPELTSWEITNVRRAKLPEDSGVKAPAFYNPALRITLVKAPGHQQEWGHVFADLQQAVFQPPRERMPWEERLQRALILSPAAPLDAAAKTERAGKLCTHLECGQDAALRRAFVLMHLEDRLEELAVKYRVDLTTFFSMRVGERMLEVNVVADTEYRMCVGGLGGSCVPDQTTWELTREEGPGDGREHLGLRVGLTKAPASRRHWDDIFTRWEPWQVSDSMIQTLLAEEAARPVQDEAVGAVELEQGEAAGAVEMEQEEAAGAVEMEQEEAAGAVEVE